jgi:hypothetical protein
LAPKQERRFWLTSDVTNFKAALGVEKYDKQDKQGKAAFNERKTT